MHPSQERRGLDFRWERLRRVLQYVSQDAHASDIPTTFQPGDIAVCRVGIERTFYDNLMELGLPLRRSEQQRYDANTQPPVRFCVINRHVTGNLYEVYLLTTFGGATYHQVLDGVAQIFAMPMGLTKWPRRVPGIKTKPRLFGQDISSFLFALPAQAKVIPSRVPARVPLEELERIRAFADMRKQVLARHSWEIRHSMKGRSRSWEGDSTNAFSLTPENTYSVLLDDDVINHGPFVKPYVPRVLQTSSEGFIKYSLSDLRWISQNLKQEIMHVSRYLRRKPISLLPRSALPRPYYANCLRISSKKLMQMIR